MDITASIAPPGRMASHMCEWASHTPTPACSKCNLHASSVAASRQLCGGPFNCVDARYKCGSAVISLRNVVHTERGKAQRQRRSTPPRPLPIVLPRLSRLSAETPQRAMHSTDARDLHACGHAERLRGTRQPSCGKGRLSDTRQARALRVPRALACPLAPVHYTVTGDGATQLISLAAQTPRQRTGMAGERHRLARLGAKHALALANDANAGAPACETAPRARAECLCFSHFWLPPARICAGRATRQISAIAAIGPTLLRALFRHGHPSRRTQADA